MQVFTRRQRVANAFCHPTISLQSRSSWGPLTLQYTGIDHSIANLWPVKVLPLGAC